MNVGSGDWWLNLLEQRVVAGLVATLAAARAALWANLRLVVTPGAALVPRWQGTPPRANELVWW